MRTIADDEVVARCAGRGTGFLDPTAMAVVAAEADARRPWLELDRTWAAFDGDRVVGTLRSFPAELTVPGGGRLRTSAVTAVATLTTHRRRGLASRMVAGELAATARRGEQASILIAAEWQIYGRFGYGAATEHQTWTWTPVPAGCGRRRPARWSTWTGTPPGRWPRRCSSTDAPTHPGGRPDGVLRPAGGQYRRHVR